MPLGNGTGSHRLDRELKSLDRWSIAVGLFAALVALAALVEIGVAGRAVKQYYAERAVIEAIARENFTDPPPDYPLAAFFSALTRTTFEVRAASETAPAVSDRDSLVTVGSAAIGAAALLGLIVAVLGWVWRANANLIAAGQRPDYGPGKAVAAFAIPLANLVLAPDAMRELHYRSHDEPEELHDSPVDDITAWFAAMIGGSVIISLLVAKYMLDIGSNLAIVTPLWMEFAMAAFAVLLLVSAGLLFFRLTRIVGRAQRDTLVARTPATEPPPERPRGVRLIRE